ncbi:hypothetical protein ACFFP0_22420 [Rhizobium puerariae]|uniref:Uncharacterized protein n=1 Tax=Rhizobium puerariae TaxID=1585791 RepID=A0ABV6APJ6_9HYPH
MMGPNILKSAAFAVPLAGLALVMVAGERSGDERCAGSLAFEKSLQIVEDRPGVVGISSKNFRWMDGCRFAMDGYADVETVNGPDRMDFELVVAFDPGSRRWQQISLSMTQ